MSLCAGRDCPFTPYPLTLKATLLPYPTPLAFTSNCSTSSRLCTNQSSIHSSGSLHCPHCCNTIARLLGKVRPSTGPPLCTPYTIANWQRQYRATANHPPYERDLDLPMYLCPGSPASRRQNRARRRRRWRQKWRERARRTLRFCANEWWRQRWRERG